MLLARVETRGIEEAKKRIEKRIFKLSGKDPKVYGDIQQIVYQSTATNFGSQGRPSWPVRSPAYEEKATWPILAKTGKLLNSVLRSIQNPWKHQGKRHLLNIYSIFYGFFHEYGKRQKIRRFVSLLGQEKRQITAVLKRALHGD
jgi:phage gpG-like protein